MAIDLGPFKPIASAVDLWRQTHGGSADAQAAGVNLRKLIWEPLEPAIGNAKTLLISPDDSLGGLPFSALPGRAAGKFLVEEYRLALVPAPRLLPEMRRHEDGSSRPANALLAVGGVDYDVRSASEEFQEAAQAITEEEFQIAAGARGAVRAAADGLNWSALPATATEVDEIVDLYEHVAPTSMGVRVLKAAAATEEAFRQLAPSCRILHAATHGFFAAPDKQSALEAGGDGAAPRYDNGVLSGIVLAGANNQNSTSENANGAVNVPEDGILTAAELAFLPLGGVELVVLSACDTGLGDVAGGEGLLGIQRAFQIAGARSTIATLWKVDDEWTKRLMTAFYRNMLEGKQSPLDALRDAQLEMLRKTRVDNDGSGVGAAVRRGADAPEGVTHGSPYYWAAFTFSGDWE